MTIENFETVMLTCIFIIPGFIIDGIISTFIPPKKKNEGLHFLLFLMYSVLHLAVWGWLYSLIWRIREKNLTIFLLLLCLSAVITSFLLGIILGLLKKTTIFRKILNKFNFNVSHDIENAWDYIFSQQKASYLVILLNDDTEIYGWYGSKSFSSSTGEERDIFIEEVYDKNWEIISNCTGLYISKDKIKTINFYKGDETNVQQ